MAIHPSLTPEHAPPPSRSDYKRVRRGTLLVIFLTVAILFAVIVGAGLLRRFEKDRIIAAAEKLEEDHPLIVNVVRAKAAPASSTLNLPCDLQAMIDSPIFPRADGYLRKRLVDIGDRVKAGQLMAEIDSPELDQQMSQARATIAQAQAQVKQYEAAVVQSRANLRISQLTRDRWARLSTAGVVSRQDADDREAVNDARKAELEASLANVNAGHSAIEAAEANLRRLQEMKSFSRVTAPFDGIVTARLMDIGTLVSAGNSGPAREMFHVAQLDPIRVFVNVPQASVASIHPGQSAELIVDQLPDRVFHPLVQRTTNSLDPTSRTMSVILEAPNPGRVLLPGMYAHIRFVLPQATGVLMIPGDTLIARSDGTHVARVGRGNRIQLQRIELGRDFGNQVEVFAGLKAGDILVVNPTDEIRENVLVETRTAGAK